MLMIIAHHCVVHGGAIGMELCANKYIALFLLPGGKVCFDAFLAISAWFMVGQSFKTERFLKTWAQVFFYSVVVYLLTLAFGSDFSLRSFLSTLLPMTGNSHGFAASYLAFYLLIPFLKIIADRLNRTQAKWLVILLLYFQVFSQIIGRINGYYQPLYSELLLFVLCYFIANYLRKYPLAITKNTFAMLAVFILTWIAVFAIWCMSTIYFPNSQIVSYLFALCNDESSVLYLIGGYAFFFFFNSIQMPTVNAINTVAHTTFGTLLIHDHNFFRYILWGVIFHASTWYYTPSIRFILLIGFCTVSIFVVCGAIDWIRQRTLERWVFQSNAVHKFCIKYDELVNIQSQQ